MRNEDNLTEAREDQEPISVHFYTRGLLFPVMIYVYDTRELEIIHILGWYFERVEFTTEDICRWCMAHDVRYRIPTELINWTLWKRIMYRRMQTRLKLQSREWMNDAGS